VPLTTRRPLQVIIFTQFWQHMLLLELFLKRHRVPLAMFKQVMAAGEKAENLRRCVCVLGGYLW
jgi:hypothetical protein